MSTNARLGRDFLLKIGDSGSPETFSTVGALRTTRMSLNNSPVDVTNIGSNGFREMLSGRNVQSVTFSGDGIFADTAAEEALRQAAFGSTITNFQIFSGGDSGDSFDGAFIVTSYERSGSHDGAEAFSVTMESSGQITFTAA